MHLGKNTFIVCPSVFKISNADEIIVLILNKLHDFFEKIYRMNNSLKLKIIDNYLKTEK